MDVREKIDPAYRSLVKAIAANPPDWTDPPAERARRAALAPPPPICSGVDWSDHRAPGESGDAPVTLRMYRPAQQTDALPLVYWIHGGGYLAGTYEGSNDVNSEWARDLGCAVISVEYRLAPEHPYPAPLEDCYTGLKWVVEHAAELGIDPSRIIISGGSAGGGLCAGLALLIRDRAQFTVTHQVLIYPMINDQRTSLSNQWTTWVWTKEANEFGWNAYLGDLSGRDDVPAYAAASRAKDLAGLPPAYVMVGTLDLFLDEDIDYATRLVAAGVPTELHVYPGAPHGFEIPRLGGQLPLGQRAQADTKDYLRRALAENA
jgi:acetyl esterase/lipase